MSKEASQDSELGPGAKLTLDADHDGVLRPCEVCNGWTDGVAVVTDDTRTQRFFLCDEHRTRAEVAKRVDRAVR
jgi:hypothetical protein